MDGNESDDSENEHEEHHDADNQENQRDDDENSSGSSGPPFDDDGGGGENSYENDDGGDGDSIVERYDIEIAATHSYLGPALAPVGGRALLEGGWRGRIPALAHHGAVFPGESVPMLLHHASDAALLAQAIEHDKLFGLLCPDETGVMLSGYGVLCEVLMASIEEEQQSGPTCVTFRARAINRFRLQRVPKLAVPLQAYTSAPAQKRLRSMDAAATPWPLFVYDIFDYGRMRRTIREYFKTMSLDEKMPEDPVSLSFWVASNLALTARDRLALFVVDNALLRLHMQCAYINQHTVLCCSSCMTDIALREYIFPMSSEGVHSNYTNLGGYMHDILTVRQAFNVETSGGPSAEYSWFPGYRWTVAVCSGCMAHVGWSFEAEKRNLRPYRFYGLCRNYVQPRSDLSLAVGAAADTSAAVH